MLGGRHRLAGPHGDAHQRLLVGHYRSRRRREHRRDVARKKSAGVALTRHKRIIDAADTARSSFGISMGIAGGVRAGAPAMRFAVTTNSTIAGAASSGWTAGRFAVTTITPTPAGNCAGAATFVPAAEADVTMPSDNSVPNANPTNVFTTLSNHSPYADKYVREGRLVTAFW